MESYLVIQLLGPMGAWGSPGPAEVRPCEVHPTKSAVLGLCAAALGIRRGQDAELEAVHKGYAFASLLRSPGTLLVDYHTAEASRTVQSWRQYRTDAWAAAALRALPHAPATLEALGEALRCPVFPLYLGRRSCPLMLPLHPQVVQAEDAAQALLGAKFPSDEDGSLRWVRSGTATLRFEEPLPGRQPLRTVVRRDVPTNRSQWQFEERQEHELLLEVPR